MSENTTTQRRSKSLASIERTRRARRKRNLITMLVSFVTFFVGYYLLNFVAALEKPPLGDTFNIVLGCSIMAVTALVLVLTIKKQYFPKKRKRTKHIFLDDLDYQKKHEIETEG